MQKLYCQSCRPRKMMENGKENGKEIYLCSVVTESGFRYDDFYLEPKQIGYYYPSVVVRKYEFKGRTRFLPVARLDEYIGLVVSEGQDSTRLEP